MHRSVALGLCAVVSLAAAVACGQRANDDTPSLNAALADDPTASSIDPRRPLAAQEWVRCWFVRDASLVDVMCKRSDAATYPYQVQDVYVSARSASTHAYLGDSGRHGPILNRHTPELRATISRDDFPIELEVRAKVFSAHAGEPIDVFVTPSELVTQKRVVGAAASESSPIVITQPFELWPVRVVMTGSQGYELQSDTFDVGVAPFRTSGTSGIDHVSARISSSVRFASHTFLLPAPSGGHVDVNATMHESGGAAGATGPLSVTGPGLFIAEDTGVRPATESEAQELLADFPAPPPTPAPTPTPMPDPTQTADAGAPPPPTPPPVAVPDASADH